MSMSAKQEYALLSKDEISMLNSTHHPGIYDLSHQELVNLRVRLRDLRSKAKTVSRQKQREERGKADPRGKNFPSTAEKPQQRKQVFAAALKRVNKEIQVRAQVEAKAAHVEAAHKALAMARKAKFEPSHPTDRTAGAGMRPQDYKKRRRIIPGGKVGSIMKRTSVAQAIRDAR